LFVFKLEYIERCSTTVLYEAYAHIAMAAVS